MRIPLPLAAVSWLLFIAASEPLAAQNPTRDDALHWIRRIAFTHREDWVGQLTSGSLPFNTLLSQQLDPNLPESPLVGTLLGQLLLPESA